MKTFHVSVQAQGRRARQPYGRQEPDLSGLFMHGLNKERWETIVSSGSLERALEVKAQGIVNFIGFSSHYKTRLRSRMLSIQMCSMS